MNKTLSMLAILFVSFACLTGTAICSNTVIDGGFSTGTFGLGSDAYLKYWETQGASWGPWQWERYDTNGDGSLDYCFSFRPRLNQECTIDQELYLIDGETYEIGLDIAVENC